MKLDVRFVIGAVTIAGFGLIWLSSVWFLWRKKHKAPLYLLLFSIFFVYAYKVVDYTLLQFQSLLLLKHFKPQLRLNGLTAQASINLIPLVSLTHADLETSLLNVLLMMPFGFGLPFLVDLRMKQVVIIGALSSISIELLQFITGLLGGMTFRVADINDVIFNTLGVAVGYAAFAGLLHLLPVNLRWSGWHPASARVAGKS